MKTAYWLAGCALCIAGIGSAAATSMDAQDTDGTAHTASDVVSAHDVNGGGDAAGLSHDSTVRGAGSDAAPSNAGNGTGHSGGSSSAPVQIRQPHLGWQSLLPGSIQ
jgi:hypothetical protein